MIYSGGPIEGGIPNVDLVSFIFERAGERGDRPALIDGPTGRTLSYAELERDVRCCAAGLAARGLGKGDVFAIFMPNALEYAVAFYGSIAAGGACTTVNPLYTARELGLQLTDSGARMLLTVPAFLEGARGEGATPFAQLLGDPGDAPDPGTDPAGDIAALPYSSGTTGAAKGVMLSHRNLVANTLQMSIPFRVGPEEAMILVLWSGAALVTMPRFELGSYLELSERYRVTRAYVVPPLAPARHPAVDQHDLSSLQTVICAAAPLGAELEDACSARLGCPVIQRPGRAPQTHPSD